MSEKENRDKLNEVAKAAEKTLDGKVKIASRYVVHADSAAGARGAVVDRVDLVRIFGPLVEAGWTIEPPEPRFRVEQNFGSGIYSVIDTQAVTDKNVVVKFGRLHPDPETAARAEADHLNGKEMDS